MTLDHLFPATRAVAIAHRGGSKLRPENTMEAFDHAVALGVDALECDVHLSADGVPAVIHDATLERTTDAAGQVAAWSMADLATVDAGARFGEAEGHPFRGRGLGVPRLADVLDRHPDVPVIVEIKGDNPQAVPAILEVLRKSRRPDRYLVGGFSQHVLDAVRTLAPQYPTGASREEVLAAIRRAYFRLPPRRSGFSVFQVPFHHQGKQIFRAPFVRTVTRAGLGVQAWIIDDEAEMRRLMSWGVTGLISDRPDVAVAVTRAQSLR